MSGFQRFAIYAAPPPGPLAEFAAAWLGWDPILARKADHPALPGLPRPIEDITDAPRKYGFHATLKPPFRLADTSSLPALEADLERLAARLAPVSLAGLTLAPMGRFLALVPEGDTARIDRLAADLVRGLDPHRAPLSQGERARYETVERSAVLAENLTRWGYPWVMQAFRFHFTLTGRLTKSETDAVKAVLAPRLLPLLPRPFPVDALCLFAEDADGRFRTLARYPLKG